jgi:hypothetical protein
MCQRPSFSIADHSLDEVSVNRVLNVERFMNVSEKREEQLIFSRKFHVFVLKITRHQIAATHPIYENDQPQRKSLTQGAITN